MLWSEGGRGTRGVTYSPPTRFHCFALKPKFVGFSRKDFGSQVQYLQVWGAREAVSNGAGDRKQRAHTRTHKTPILLSSSADMRFAEAETIDNLMVSQALTPHVREHIEASLPTSSPTVRHP